MRIILIALGTRGDVQPYVALGKGLRAAGNDVGILTHRNYADLVQAHGLEFWPADGNVQDIVESAEMRALIERGNFFAITARTAQAAKGAAVQWAHDGLAACQGADLLIAGMGGLYIALALAEKLRLPLLQAYLVPFTPTTAFASVLLAQTPAWLGGGFNHLSHHATRQVMWQSFRTADNLVRRQTLGLAHAPFWGPYRAGALQGMPVLYGFSPAVLPKPKDWDETVQVTGYWFLNAESAWTPPAALTDFLRDGPPPVYLGFGSMSNRKPAETTSLVLDALAQAGQRAILLSGWGGLRQDDLPETVLALDSVPHDWLFPHMAAVVHHGGAGTTAAGLAAGVPSIMIPFFGDQPFWGKRIAELGVGPAPIPRKQLTADRLAQALRQAVDDSTMRQRAARLGATIRAEDGVARAVAVVQGALQGVMA